MKEEQKLEPAHDFGPFDSRPGPKFYEFPNIRCIPDFEPLMHRYKPEYHDYIRKGAKMMDDFEIERRSPEWTLTVENKKESVNLWQKLNKGALNCLKMEGFIEASPKDVMRVLTDNRYKSSWDPSYRDYSVLETIGD